MTSSTALTRTSAAFVGALVGAAAGILLVTAAGTLFMTVSGIFAALATGLSALGGAVVGAAWTPGNTRSNPR
jgi:hypothetical protein